MKKLDENIMRKLLTFLLLFSIAVSSYAAYYVAGNGTSGNPWCDGKTWQVNGSLMTADASGVSSVTFKSVPVG